MTSLSDYYLGLTPTVVPTFEKYLQRAPTLEPHLVDETIRFAPQLTEDMPIMSLLASIQLAEATTSRVEIKFTASQLKAIRAAAEREATNKISTSDALSGYLVTVLNRISPVTIENITNIISVSFSSLYNIHFLIFVQIVSRNRSRSRSRIHSSAIHFCRQHHPQFNSHR